MPRDTRTRLLSGAAVLAAAALLSACSSTAAPAAAPGGQQQGIVAHGEGKVSGSPDTVTLVLGAQTQATSARDALAQNNAKTGAIVAMLKAKGVAPKDLQTSELSISPMYGSSPGGSFPGGSFPGGDNRITGYQVSNIVTATLHDIGSSGAVIDAAADAAGDAVRVQQLSFSIADDSALRAQARAAAVTQAKDKAKQLADAAGVSLGPLLSITEGSSTPPPVPYAAQASRAMADAPVEPGSQRLSVTVDLVYAVG
jgi:hypothetical protein